MFVPGKTYSRLHDIHGRFDGQRQGGVSTPADAPFVFLFTGIAGEAHGYADGWADDGTFLYTGEGQRGDMRFEKGNRAIRDHIQNGKSLLLFEALGKRKPVRFVGTFNCQSWGTIRTNDTDGNPRDAIQFHLVPDESSSQLAVIAEPDVSVSDTPVKSLDELRVAAQTAARPVARTNAREARRLFRERSKAVRDYVLARANGVCELTGKPAPFIGKNGCPYLEVHHVRRVADDGPDDPRWVAAICPTVHREIHFGQNGDALNHKLEKKLREIEPLQST